MNEIIIDLEELDWTDADSEEENVDELCALFLKYKLKPRRVPKVRNHNERKTRTQEAWNKREQKTHQV